MLISVRLYVQGEELRPTEITKLLGVLPVRSHARGDTRTLPDGKTVAQKIGVWVWKTGMDAEDASLGDCIQSLRKTFDQSRGVLTSLPNAESTWVDVHVVGDRGREDDSDGEVVLSLAPEDLGALTALGLPVEVTVGFA